VSNLGGRQIVNELVSLYEEESSEQLIVQFFEKIEADHSKLNFMPQFYSLNQQLVLLKNKKQASGK
jgi:hypothetical protein